VITGEGPGDRRAATRADHGVMAEPDLVRRALAAGISPVYENWRRERVEVPEKTLEALLAAFDRGGGMPPGPALPTVPAGRPAPERTALPALPRSRTWGFTVQLYSVRSRQSWGHGDLADLAELVTWSGRELGAGFILLNPLYAAEPLPPVSPSPYLPMTRMFLSPLYLRIEDVPEYQGLAASTRDHIQQLAAPLRAQDTSADLLDRDAVWRAKRSALELMSQVRLSTSRQEQFDAFLADRGADLERWAAWCALAEQHGPDWRRWPDRLRSPAAGVSVVAGEPSLRSAAQFHSWLQWQCDQQLAAAQRAALEAGMPVGIIGDLPVGVHPGGADAWAHQDLFVLGLDVGAPPDSFNQLGQDWGQPPWHPQRLAAADYRPLAELFRASLRGAGGLRVDHVMGLTRLWCIPEGEPPGNGAYVSYDAGASLGALAGTAAQAGAIAVGEDLGTVDPLLTGRLDEHHILGTMMAWFATQRDGSPLPPQRWRRTCMATVGTHDVPPVAGYVAGDQVNLRASLGLLSQPLETERAEARRTVERWQAALITAGLLRPDDGWPDPAEFTVALYGYLGRTPSLLTGVSLADAVGDQRTQNVPGTNTEYPNWRIPLCDAAGRSVLIEDLGDSPLLQDVVAEVSAGHARRASPARRA
jgi:4-alpha-glucanotransferase